VFTIIFGIELYLASYIPFILYAKYTNSELITETSFQIFGTLYSIVNFIAIFNFILNIFDVRVSDNREGVKLNSSETVLNNGMDTYDLE
jgi:hypothetical protein